MYLFGWLRTVALRARDWLLVSYMLALFAVLKVLCDTHLDHGLFIDNYLLHFIDTICIRELRVGFYKQHGSTICKRNWQAWVNLEHHTNQRSLIEYLSQSRISIAQSDPYKEREYQNGPLALAFRIFAKLGFDESVAGHTTYRVSTLHIGRLRNRYFSYSLGLHDLVDPSTFWDNPFSIAWSLLKASDLIRVNETGTVVEGGEYRILNTAGSPPNILTPNPLLNLYQHSWFITLCIPHVLKSIVSPTLTLFMAAPSAQWVELLT